MNKYNFGKCVVAAAVFVGSVLASSAVLADVVTIPQSALISSNYYYTDLVGGGLGNVMVTTGGGNAANVGSLSGRNDDGFMKLDLGFNVTFFGATYNSVFINNNGNVSFGNGISAFIPVGLTGATSPVISAFFSDVDTRSSLSGVVQYRSNIANELIVTWDNVGYYSNHGSPLNSFQLVLRGDDYVVPVGEGSIGFFYKDMGWEFTDTSRTAAVGFGDGAGNAKVIEGSNTQGMNAVVDNTHLWFNQNLTPVPDNTVPEPSSIALIGAGLAAVSYLRKKRSV